MEEEPLGSGAFGKVYNAKWRGRNVVVKVIETANEKEKQAFGKESKITLSLDHSNVIKLFGITHVKQNNQGIVMEKATQGSLDRWIGRIDFANMIKIASGIVEGLMYVHSNNVIHRDLKPQNILMFGSTTEDMIPKIADFGVSKVIDTAMTKHTGEVGTMLYMAPEVKSCKEYSFTADIYSLATVLFEIFSEQRISDTSEEVRLRRKLPKNSKVPTYLCGVIERGWDEEAENRPWLSKYNSVLRGSQFSLSTKFSV